MYTRDILPRPYIAADKGEVLESFLRSLEIGVAPMELSYSSLRPSTLALLLALQLSLHNVPSSKYKPLESFDNLNIGICKSPLADRVQTKNADFKSQWFSGQALHAGVVILCSLRDIAFLNPDLSSRRLLEDLFLVDNFQPYCAALYDDLLNILWNGLLSSAHGIPWLVTSGVLRGRSPFTFGSYSPDLSPKFGREEPDLARF